MVEVIQKGNSKKRAKCPSCLSVLEYEPFDEHIKSEYDSVLGMEIRKYFIYCPICRGMVKIRERAFED